MSMTSKPKLIATEYRVIPVGDGKALSGTIEWPRDPGFHAIDKLVQPLIGGGNIEHVTVLHEGERRDMFVDD